MRMEFHTLGVHRALKLARPKSVGDLVTTIKKGVDSLSEELIEIIGIG